MKTILITGGTGMVGKALVQMLVQKNYNIIILTRKINNTGAQQNVEYALWDVNKGTIDINAVTKANAIIHLAGAGVMDKKWTDAYKKEIEESRTKSAALIIHTLKNNPHKVKVLVSASAIGWYGADKDNNSFFTEEAPADEVFLGITCKKWEQAVEAAEPLGIRVCKLRIGIVLSKNGGAYAEFRKPLNFFTAAILGNGKQIVSWIHIEDLCRQFIYALENELLQGSYNAVAPTPVDNKTLTIAIAKAVKNNLYIPINVPTFILKIMMGDRSIEILKSTRASCNKIVATGFTYLHPSIENAIANIEQK
jgi:uncharacterized protein